MLGFRSCGNLGAKMKPTYASALVRGPGFGQIHSIKSVLLGATLALGLSPSADAAQQIFLTAESAGNNFIRGNGTDVVAP
jgi:hypothetical protein